MSDAESMDKTEVLILEVSKNPVLFNKTEKAYKDIAQKKDIWKGIGEKIGLTGMWLTFYFARFNNDMELEKKIT